MIWTRSRLGGLWGCPWTWEGLLLLFTRRCREAGLEELFLTCMKIYGGKKSKEKKPQTKSNDEKKKEKKKR